MQIIAMPGEKSVGGEIGEGDQELEKRLVQEELT
jgi:hypothetical protein